MPLSALRSPIAERFHEVDLFLTDVGLRESADPLVKDEAVVRIQRGMFFVHLYACFEYAVGESFGRLALNISSRGVSLSHLSSPMHTVALDGLLTSLQTNTNWRKKFSKRVELCRTLDSLDQATIADTVLANSMPNISSAILAIAFQAYGIRNPPLLTPAIGGYIDEVVNKRNAIAHGRESPLSVGNVKVLELRKRLASLQDQSTYVVDCINEFLNKKHFVNTWHRKKY